MLVKHHKLPTSKGGSNKARNVSYVPDSLHQAYHLLFCDYTVQDIADILNEHFVNPDFQLIVKPRL